MLPVLLLAGAAQAQEGQLDAAAAHMAAALSDSKQKSVIVFDFIGPDQALTALGQKLADEFSRSIAQSSHNVEVEDRSRIGGQISKENFTPVAIHDADMNSNIAWDMKVTSYISGTLSLNGDDLKIVAELLEAKHSKKIASSEFEIPLTDERKDLLAKIVANSAFAGYPKSGENGYSMPSCTYCPSAIYPDEATKFKIQGAVILKALIDATGQPRQIRVMKPLPHGFTEAAIQAVATWKLKPSIGPDGEPATVWQFIEVIFSR